MAFWIQPRGVRVRDDDVDPEEQRDPDGQGQRVDQARPVAPGGAPADEAEQPGGVEAVGGQVEGVGDRGEQAFVQVLDDDDLRQLTRGETEVGRGQQVPGQAVRGAVVGDSDEDADDAAQPDPHEDQPLVGERVVDGRECDHPDAEARHQERPSLPGFQRCLLLPALPWSIPVRPLPEGQPGLRRGGRERHGRFRIRSTAPVACRVPPWASVPPWGERRTSQPQSTLYLAQPLRMYTSGRPARPG
jgi:hypothetical protein